ncbi:APC family permease [Caminibacter pacificus]
MGDLKKTIGVFSGIAIAIGMVMGSGLFGLPGLAIDIAGAKLSLLGWLAIILAVIPMIYIFIKLGIKFPKAGGLSTYAKAAFGDWAEFGVVAVLSGTFIIGIPALAIIGGEYLTKLFSISIELKYFFAFLFLLFATIINIYGVQMASWINKISLIFILLLIIVLVIIHPDYLTEGIKALNFKTENIKINKLWEVMALLFWAFLGWENLSFGLEEFKNPKKTIPIIYWGSFFIVSMFYFMLALLVSGAVISGIKVSGASAIASILSDNVTLSKFLIFFMVVVIIANANSWVFGASRLIYSAGKDGILFKKLGILNKKGIPSNALITLMIFYAFFIFALYYFKIDLSTIIMIVSQNFLVLYLFSIIAFAKLFSGTIDRIVLLLSSVILLFFFQGFGVAIIYPLILLLIGFVRYKKTNIITIG